MEEVPGAPVGAWLAARGFADAREAEAAGFPDAAGPTSVGSVGGVSCVGHRTRSCRQTARTNSPAPSPTHRRSLRRIASSLMLDPNLFLSDGSTHRSSNYSFHQPNMEALRRISGMRLACARFACNLLLALGSSKSGGQQRLVPPCMTGVSARSRRMGSGFVLRRGGAGQDHCPFSLPSVSMDMQLGSDRDIIAPFRARYYDGEPTLQRAAPILPRTPITRLDSSLDSVQPTSSRPAWRSVMTG